MSEDATFESDEIIVAIDGALDGWRFAAGLSMPTPMVKRT